MIKESIFKSFRTFILFVYLVAVSIAPGRLTHRLIETTREFVINIPSHQLLHATHGCGTISGREADKFEKFGLTPVPAVKISAPLIGECIGHLECTLHTSYTVGDHTLFIGEVLSASVEEDLFDDFLKVANPEAKTIHHLGSNIYTLPDTPIESNT